ncbi:hypothetical protein AB0N06_33455 [Streptomyces sp. NPDC051020]|uniref:hypothetical protein n=1 Tax=Streptomyces sp. NPDC051020 TaxID=3155409 RepID=UPI003428A354
MVLLVAACSAGAANRVAPASSSSTASRPTPKEWTCQDGKFHWGNIQKRQVLAAVSDPQRFEIPKGKSVHASFELEPIRTIRAAITQSPGLNNVNPSSAISSLEEATGIDLEPTGKIFAMDPDDKVLKTEFTGKYSGVMASVVGVDVIEANFVYGCAEGGNMIRGTVNSWSNPTYVGLFSCGVHEKLGPSEVQAEALLCGEKKQKAS